MGAGDAFQVTERSDDHGHVEPERLPDDRTDGRGRFRFGRSEHDVATLDVGADIAQPRRLERRSELGHRQDVPTADVDAAQQCDLDLRNHGPVRSTRHGPLDVLTAVR